MSEEFGHIERIEAYLEDRLRGEDLQAFEDQLKTDADLRQELELQQMVVSAVETTGAQDLKAELKEIHQDLYPKGGSSSGNNLKYGLIATGLITIGAIAYITKPDAETPAPTTEHAIEQSISPKEKEIKEEVVDTKETTADKIEKEHPIKEKTLSEENKPTKENAPVVENKIEQGEIIFNFEKDGIPEPELVISEQYGEVYLFNGKELKFYNIDPDKIEAVTYMEVEQKLYLVYKGDCFRLELNQNPSDFIKEKDNDIIRYLKMD
jgi:hypothetical protein